MRFSAIAFLGAFAFIATLPGAALAQCFFLECKPGTPTSQAPTPPSSLPALSTAPREGTDIRRPADPREVCDRVMGYNFCASSVLAAQHGFSYRPDNLTDSKLDTAWVEGSPDDGIGEWLLVDFGKQMRVLEIRLWNGYHKNDRLFARNNRIRDIDLVFSNGERVQRTLEDRSGPQALKLDAATQAAWVQLIIRSVYRGSHYRDTAITELRIVGE